MQVQLLDVPHFQRPFPLAEANDGGGGHVETERGEGGKHREDYPQPCLGRQGVQLPAQFRLETGGLLFNEIFHLSHAHYLSIVRMSLFSSTVKPSMVKPLGLSSERLALSRRQAVTNVRSVTLLSRMIICLAYVRAS